jgi:hypothetical protein
LQASRQAVFCLHPSSHLPFLTSLTSLPQTDNNINELMERVSIGGSKALQGAGKAVKLLGKLARGLGGSSAPTDIPKPTPNRALSSSSLGGGGGLAGSMPGAAGGEECLAG